jgi:hypothetical protein
MAEVVSNISEVMRKPVPNIVTALRILLEQAERGEVVGLAYIAVTPGQFVTTFCDGDNCYHHLNSGAARLAARLAVEP